MSVAQSYQNQTLSTQHPAPMHPITKKLILDEHRRPVAVQIAYADWLEIERVLGEHDVAVEPDEEARRAAFRQTSGEMHGSGPSRVSERSFEEVAAPVRGIWTEGDGLEYQLRLRAEWDREWDSLAEDEEEGS